MKKQNIGEYIVEFRQIGSYIKVSAVDPVSFIETSIAVPAGKGVSKSDMEKLAVRKLEYVLNKNNNSDNNKADNTLISSVDQTI